MQVSAIEKYAIITLAFNDSPTGTDIRVSREITVREIIHNFFDACGYDRKSISGYYAKAEIARVLLFPTDTLKDKHIYDGDILRVQVKTGPVSTQSPTIVLPGKE